MFYLYCLCVVSGTCSLTTVHPPQLVTTALCSDVIMPCHLSRTLKNTDRPALQWDHFIADVANGKLWPPSNKYEGRVELLEPSNLSSNKSILLKRAQWADSGRYHCKLSYLNENRRRTRTKENEILLVIYGECSVLFFLFAQVKDIIVKKLWFIRRVKNV